MRMRCKPCNYNVCRACWSNRTGKLSRQNPIRAKGAIRATPVACPNGHACERLVGQLVRGDWPCCNCGEQSLGSTGAYFLCCRFCRFDLCPECAGERERGIESEVANRPDKRDG